MGATSLPESPRWLALHGRRGREHVRDSKRKWRDIGRPCRHGPQIRARRQQPFREIFQPPYGKRTLVMSIFNLMQTIGFYGFGAWVPTLLIANGIQVTTSLEYAFIIAIANPIGPLLGMLIADRMERKWQIVSAGVSIGVFMFLFANQANPAASSCSACS